MTDDHIDDLKDVLSLRLLGHPWSPQGHTPEHTTIRHLASTLRAYDSGEVSMNHVRSTFAARPVPGFDLNQWLTDKVVEGVYDRSIFEDDPDDE